jgi:hypothetical protein
MHMKPALQNADLHHSRFQSNPVDANSVKHYTTGVARIFSNR